MGGLTDTQLGKIEQAEVDLVSYGLVKKRTKLKKLSAKKIAEIVAAYGNERAAKERAQRAVRNAAENIFGDQKIAEDYE